jgi:hypothetical protein
MENITIEEIEKILNNSHWENDQLDFRFSEKKLCINNKNNSKYAIEQKGESFVIVFKKFANKPSIQIIGISELLLIVKYLETEQPLNKVIKFTPQDK